MPEPCEDEEADADGPDMEPGTEMDQGEQSNYNIAIIFTK